MYCTNISEVEEVKLGKVQIITFPLLWQGHTFIDKYKQSHLIIKTICMEII